ncbi:divalent metal cation transporter (ZT_dimer domain) [Campylobacter blaseri]|uniref:Cation-efflux pump n=1 Tax=Campylobacter blaseri TaxID=2042961 RepID=A0A2P8QZU7_9BACT|nr:cation diffusion facilitator family transporter [Campylobacter blaseri]PSM51752.1 cation-efflux pump [Campylobacter blaseri]PSM53543.1 cation-efflux pump [Campylobacter blaseri]QKF86350.1 divalent metal cation transporter (ZT_dimer domain) [Campylobacter blaseri]
MMDIKNKAPFVAGLTAVMLAIVKLIIGLFSGSVSVIASAIDSILDAIVSAANYIVVSKSDQEPDGKFNYGYAKLEAIMSFLEGFFIAGIGSFIVYSGAMKIINPQGPIKLNIALYVMIFSFIVTGFLIVYLTKIYKKTNSLIIKTDILHYKSDFFSNLAIIAGLVVVYFTGWHIVDSIFGIAIGLYIMYGALGLIKESGYILIDGAVDEDIVLDIKEFINSNSKIRDFHDFKTRKCVNKCYLSIHLVFDRDILLFDAHEIGDSVEKYITEKYNQYEWDINLHFDPYDDSKIENI